MQQYRFVTNGRHGRLAEFTEFIARLTDGRRTGRARERDETKILQVSFAWGTERFSITSQVATRNGGAGGVTSGERALVFHLVRRFELKFGVGLNELAADIEKHLRPNASRTWVKKAGFASVWSESCWNG